jgi:hypothetical protein
MSNYIKGESVFLELVRGTLTSISDGKYEWASNPRFNFPIRNVYLVSVTLDNATAGFTGIRLTLSASGSTTDPAASRGNMTHQKTNAVFIPVTTAPGVGDPYVFQPPSICPILYLEENKKPLELRELFYSLTDFNGTNIVFDHAWIWLVFSP